MIKFFRKIRYDLMEKNKTTNYLKYAIGEIILVVIGILIALQINNWNENRKERNLEKQYIERLTSQFQKDSVYLSKFNKSMKFIVPYLKNMDSILALIESKSLKPNDYVKIPVFLTLQSQFVTKTTVIDELNNTGNMALIKSIELKDALVAYKNAVSEQINLFNRTNLKNSDFDNYLIVFGILKNSFYDIQVKYINNEFENRYWFVIANRKGFNKAMAELEKQCNNVLNLLRNLK